MAREDIEWFDQNVRARRALLLLKAKRYRDSWKMYQMIHLLKLALHRMEEVVDRFEDTGAIDVDNLMDSMNFADFAIAKAKQAKNITGASK